jgi:predicted adenine nucleotide alpha hydrolase (AANH) superfamily ATPase
MLYFGKRKRHAATDDHFVDQRQQIANELYLVGDFRAAENGDERSIGRLSIDIVFYRYPMCACVFFVNTCNARPK